MIKSILKNLIINHEKKNELNNKLKKIFKPTIFQESINEEYNLYMNFEDKINNLCNLILKDIDILNENKEYKSSLRDFLKNCINFVKIAFKFRLYNHNYFYMKKINDYILLQNINNDNNELEKDYKCILKVLLDKEYDKILTMKSSLNLFNNFVNKKKKDEFELIHNEYLSNLEFDIILSNKLRKEQIKINIREFQIQDLVKELDKIYNYLISNIDL